MFFHNDLIANGASPIPVPSPKFMCEEWIKDYDLDPPVGSFSPEPLSGNPDQVI
jgi:hypothetical protein